MVLAPGMAWWTQGTAKVNAWCLPLAWRAQGTANHGCHSIVGTRPYTHAVLAHGVTEQAQDTAGMRCLPLARWAQGTPIVAYWPYIGLPTGRHASYYK